MIAKAAKMMVVIQNRTTIFDSCQLPFGQFAKIILKSAGICPGKTLNVSCIGARLNTRSFSPFLLPCLAYEVCKITETLSARKMKQMTGISSSLWIVQPILQ